MKISYKDYRYILDMKKKTPFIQKLLRYDLFVDSGRAWVKCSIPIWLYILSFFPVHIINLFICLWDGGLKEFEFASRTCANWFFYKDDVPYDRAKEIWEKA